jgi:hypothetical protein
LIYYFSVRFCFLLSFSLYTKLREDMIPRRLWIIDIPVFAVLHSARASSVGHPFFVLFWMLYVHGQYLYPNVTALWELEVRRRKKLLGFFK